MKPILNIIGATVIASAIFPLHLKSQESTDFKNAFGIRAGGTSGLTYKHKFEGGHAMEFILGSTFYGVHSFTALYEKHNATKTSGLNWYAGGGVHFSSARRKTYYAVYEDKNRYYYYKTYPTYSPAFGIDGIVGLEYKLEKIPLAFSFDVKPNIEIDNYGGTFMYLDPGLGLKLAF